MIQRNPKPKLSENWPGGVLKAAESIHHSTPTGKLHIVCNNHNMEGLGEARGCQEETYTFTALQLTFMLNMVGYYCCNSETLMRQPWSTL